MIRIVWLENCSKRWVWSFCRYEVDEWVLNDLINFIVFWMLFLFYESWLCCDVYNMMNIGNLKRVKCFYLVNICINSVVFLIEFIFWMCILNKIYIIYENICVLYELRFSWYIFLMIFLVIDLGCEIEIREEREYYI